MESNNRIEEKENLVLRHWGLFPINSSIIPLEISGWVATMFSNKTSKEIIITSLNNTFNRLYKKKHCSRSSEIGQAFLDKSKCNYTKLLSISVMCRS